MTLWLSLGLTAVLALAAPAVPMIGRAPIEAASIPTFDDVPATYFAYPWVEALYAHGIASECDEGELMFCPEAEISHAQMTVFLSRGIYGSAFEPPPATGAVFADLPATHPFAEWIEQLVADSVTVGCATSPAHFCPDDQVTRDEMAALLLRAKYKAGYTPPPATGLVFNDVPADHPFASWIEELAAEGLTAGCGGGNYCPDAPVTRGQMAVFLVRAFQLPM